MLLSTSNFFFHVSHCLINEFEDNICDFDFVDLLAPVSNISPFSRVIAKLKKRIKVINYFQPPRVPLLFNKIILEKEYDLFLFICQKPYELNCLNQIKGWSKKCSIAVCLLDELWKNDVERWKRKLEVLKYFDHIFTHLSSSANAVANIVQRPCHFIPYGVDTAKFYPSPLSSERAIDVYNLGRRSPITHKALIELANQEDFFYIYDTIRNLYFIDYKEHRNLYSNLVKRSSYFIVNKAKFDCFNETGGQEELGPRFFEGAAGGTVMLGTPPNCEGYNKYFDWSDAVIQIPSDAADIADVLANLNAQPERLARIRTENVVNSLLRHDWVYRWGKILDTVGLEHTPEMRAREVYLKNLAQMWANRKH